MEDYEAFGQLRERPMAGAPPLPQAPARPRKKRAHWLRNTLLLIVAYFAVAVVTTVQPIPLPFLDARVSAPFPGGAPLLFGLPNRPYVVLVIGLDRRPAETGGSRTDTVLLVRVDPKRNKAAFLSIPRDAMMQVPAGDGTFSRDRINTAFVYNFSSKDPSAAPEALAATIQHNLGIKVDHYVIFDQYNAKDLIDAMGGVTVDNPREFGQADYSDDDVNVVPQQFPVGRLKLNGYEAVAYGRIRQGSSDFDRIERQQRVASALIAKASSPLSILRIPSAWGAYRSAVDSDMSLRQSAGVLAMLKRVPDGKLKTRSLADAAVSCSDCSASVQLLDAERVRTIIAETFGDARAGDRAAELLRSAGVAP